MHLLRPHPDLPHTAHSSSLTFPRLRVHRTPHPLFLFLSADTMDEVCPEVPGMISLTEYETLVAQRPQMLSRLSLNLSGIIGEYSKGATV